MTIKVLMLPHLDKFGKEESGIKRVVEAYFHGLPDFGIEMVAPDATTYDVKATHAGMTGGDTDCAILHGLYWSADYFASGAEYAANAKIVEAVRSAKKITVPSEWVAETLRRDMRINPHVVGHGINWREWKHNEKDDNYILWNKNRTGVDVCYPEAVGELANRFPNNYFLTTFAPDNPTPNIKATGVVPHSEMKLMIQRATVYLSTVKETFGIGVLEAMASGVPVLGWRYGGNVDLITHGVSGYLATPGDYDNLAAGLDYCMKYRRILGDNARELVKKWTWEAACEKMAHVLKLAAQPDDPPTVAIIVPTYNYGTHEKLGRAISSAMAQTFPVSQIIVVDDGSTDDGATERLVSEYNAQDQRVKYHRQNNSGVAVARNTGIGLANTKYVCCLDADDKIEPLFIERCVDVLERDRSLGVAFTQMKVLLADGEIRDSNWPSHNPEFDKQVKRQNQVPTCSVFRKQAWERLGGYRSRYIPPGMGCGAEDAEFYLRMGSIGYRMRCATDERLFTYSLGTGYTTGLKGGYHEVNWVEWHPWSRDGQHPFASIATPAQQSHPVRQYDEPAISVIIPVGPGHENKVYQALDSLEAQSFRKWEVIVVDDTKDGNAILALTAYPYARIFKCGGKGAGAARNLGVKHARAPLVLFLDADDWLLPHALEGMLRAWNNTQTIIYSDYIGKAFVSPEEAGKLKEDKRLLYYGEKDQEAIIRYYASLYNCQRAVIQPDLLENDRVDNYIWCLISCLLPKAWHDEIGGFDESMVSWEDWDYWIRMARVGKCFTRIADPMVVYRFYTGARRERGGQEAKSLIKYMLEKRKVFLEHKGEIDVCQTCGKGSNSRNNEDLIAQQIRAQQGLKPGQSGVTMADADMVLITYKHPNEGRHAVYGHATGTPYGHRKSGEEFLVDKRDIAVQPNLFVLKAETPQAAANTGVVVVPAAPPEPPPPPAPVPVKVTPVPEPVSVTPTPASVIEVVEDTVQPETKRKYHRRGNKK